MTAGSSANAGMPPHGVRLPVRVSESAVQRCGGGGGGGGARSRPREVLSLSFAHRPERLDANRPATLGPAGPLDDRVALTFGARPRPGGGATQQQAQAEGIRLVGTRKPLSKSQARDYLLIYAGDCWYIEPVTESITGIKPVQPGPQESVPAPNIPDSYETPQQDSDPDPWFQGGGGPHSHQRLQHHHRQEQQPRAPSSSGIALSTAPVAVPRSRPVSPSVPASSNGLSTGLENRQTVAGKSTPGGSQQNTKRKLVRGGPVEADDAGSPPRSPNQQAHPQKGGKSVGCKTVGGKGPRRTSGASDSDSGSGSSGSSASSGSSSSSDSVEYTDASGSESE